MPWGYIILGLVAGIASGAFGIGGGAIIVPALSVWFGVPYHVAVGTSLALIIPISLSPAASPTTPSAASTGKSSCFAASPA
jgi:uncharacterized membrane protein YfcA